MAQYNAAPLIFITSTTSTAPQGRNARVHARSQDAARSLQSGNARPGDFGCFSIDIQNASSLPRIRPNRNSRLSNVRTKINPSIPRPPKCQAITTLTVYGDPTPILALAHFHLGRIGVSLAEAQPIRLKDTLRFRHWTRACIVHVSTSKRSSCVNNAIVCLETKLQELLRANRPPNVQMLGSYQRAIHDIRAALSPSAHVPADEIILATQLMAVFEMLDAPDEGTWKFHTTGAVALLMSNKSGCIVSITSAWPLLAEALLDDGKGPFSNCPCQSLVTLVNASINKRDELTQEMMDLLQQTAALIDQRRSAAPEPNSSVRFSLLGSAHELRNRLHTLAMTAGSRSSLWIKASDFDYLGFGLVCLVALNEMILALRPNGPRPLKDIEEETHGTCLQLLKIENGDVAKDRRGRRQ